MLTRKTPLNNLTAKKFDVDQEKQSLGNQTARKLDVSEALKKHCLSKLKTYCSQVVIKMAIDDLKAFQNLHTIIQ